ncbi:hypothetical protein [Streptomyces sp. NPDC093589]|uniref:hypothetical protein n=1 Tax=Streptomyces sp. NPDC093589 TaxID=3366043 RepID=UPI0037F34D7C
MGEGAGMLVLERTADAQARGARARGRIRGFGASSDAHHVVKPSPDGAGLAAALREALARAGASAEDVSHINAHGTGTPLGDRVEAAVLADLFPHRPLVTSTKAVPGHLMGAAGAVEAALTVLAVEQGLVPEDPVDEPLRKAHLCPQNTPHPLGLDRSSRAGDGGDTHDRGLLPERQGDADGRESVAHREPFLRRAHGDGQIRIQFAAPLLGRDPGLRHPAAHRPRESRQADVVRAGPQRPPGLSQP